MDFLLLSQNTFRAKNLFLTYLFDINVQDVQKIPIKKFFFDQKKNFSVEFFFSKFEFVILIEPPFNPQNDFS